jgi:hypothetical protein
MTSVATVFGHFPLTLVTGPGAAARNSIGLVLVAGMTIGTAFTLFLVPAIYLLIARDHRRDSSIRDVEAAPADEAAWPGMGEPEPAGAYAGAGLPARRPGTPAPGPESTLPGRDGT